MLVTEDFIQSWFALQRELIGGLRIAYVDLHGPGVQHGGFAVSHPQGLAQSEELVLAARLARRSQAPVTGQGGSADGGAPILRIACPLKLGEHTEGAVVVEVMGSIERQVQVLKTLQWAEAALQLAFAGQQNIPRAGGMQMLLDVALDQAGYADTRTAVLNLLPESLDCSRVAFGRAVADRVQIEAVSGIDELDRRSARVQACQAAMAEAVAIQRTLQWPSPGDESAGGERQAALLERAGLQGVCSVPLSHGLRSPIVFCFEFADPHRLDADTRVRCEEAVRTVAPLLELRHALDRPWWRRLIALGREGIGRLTGRNGRRRSLAVLVLTLLFAVLAFAPARYRVSAPAALEGAVQQAIVAPFDGYVVDAPVRAGEPVGKGAVLARMDDQALVAERRRLRAEQAEYAEQYRQAIATLDQSTAKVLDAQLDQTRARLALVEEQLDRTELRAPLDGLVISGDWSRSLGVPVSRGDLMFQVAPLDRYRVAVQVSDRDIAGFALGQRGELVLSALPRVPIVFRVSAISAQAADAAAEPGFRVEGKLDEHLDGLRPGMHGVAKITLGDRPRWWVWTHGLTDWLRLQLWRLLP